MLIKCPECNESISDKAISCPHCGFPIVDNSKSYPQKTTEKKSRKKKRLPNGFGQITKVKGNLRNPYRAMVTVGKTEEGKPICKLLKPKSYFKTYNDAYAALVEYNKNPYSLSSEITCKELFEKWIEEYSKTVTVSSERNIRNAWLYCEELYDLPVAAIRIRHIKKVLDEGTNSHTGSSASRSTKGRIKILWNMLLDYAVEYELVDRNYARMFTVKARGPAKASHISYSDDEMRILWRNKENEIASMILIQCYMGWRPQELCDILMENVNIEEWFIIGGMKTQAGEKRIVYVLPAIQGLVMKWYSKAKELNSKYLFNIPSRSGVVGHLTYSMYRQRFNTTIKALKISSEHRSHDCRKHFITMAKKVNMDEYAIKKIVGHAISDITEKIYTDRDPDWLYNEMYKLVGITYE